MKPLDRAKSRLAGLGDDVRRDLALAFLLDVLDAVRGAPDVLGIVVVTSDDRVAGRVRAELGARVQVVPDAEPMELNHALHRGVAALASANGAGVPVPVRGPTTRARAVRGPAGADGGRGGRPARGRAPVRSRLRRRPHRRRDDRLPGRPAPLRPAFRRGSRDAHAEQGATDLTAFARPELRADVDTPEDLWALLAGATSVGRRWSSARPRATS